MSDYQEVTVIQIEGRTLVMEVVEEHPDMDALASIVSEGKLTGKREDIAKIAAELVLEHNNCRNALCAAALRSRGETELWPTQQEFVAEVSLRSAEVIGESSCGLPRYHAMLEVTLTRDEYLREFSVGDSWRTVATSAKEDTELCDFWDHVR